MKVSFALVPLALAPPAAAQFDPPVAVDINSDPDIVEVELTAAVTTWQFVPGVDTEVWAYNGSVPGPTIVAQTGNKIIVHLTNDLPEATTIHWHGVELPAVMDGSHIAQALVPPGGSYTYEFTALQDALYWYHPHVRPFDQVEKGLYAALLVKNPFKDAEFQITGVEEHIVMFDDILVDANMQVVPAFSFTDPLQNALYHLNGREGNLLLVNGREASGVTLPVPNGVPQRWRIVNTANTTFCRLNLNDDEQGLGVDVWEIGSDGGYNSVPFLKLPVVDIGPEHPGQTLLSEMGQGILLFPGERTDVVFTPRGSAGETFRVLQHDWPRGRHGAMYGPNGEILLPDDPNDGNNPPQEYFQLQLVGPDPGTPSLVPPATLETFPPLPTPQGTLGLTFGHGLPDPATGNVILFAQGEMVNGILNPLPAPKIDSFKALDVNVGESWQWRVTNLTHGDHPFHTHGFFFELVEYEWSDDVNPSFNIKFNNPVVRRRKDTIRVPARTGAKGTSRSFTTLAVTFDDTGREEHGGVVAMGQLPTFEADGDHTSGGWLAHCHVLEHSGKGMLTFYEVHDTDEKFRFLGKHLAGTNGNPSLTATGDLTPGSLVRFHLVNALPDTPFVIVIGRGLANQPFAGGTIVPNLEFFLGGVADSEGQAVVPFPGWETFDPGTTLYVQAGFRDPGGQATGSVSGGSLVVGGRGGVGGPSVALPKVGGWAMSNALSFSRP